MPVTGAAVAAAAHLSAHMAMSSHQQQVPRHARESSKRSARSSMRRFLKNTTLLCVGGYACLIAGVHASEDSIAVEAHDPQQVVQQAMREMLWRGTEAEALVATEAPVAAAARGRRLQAVEDVMENAANALPPMTEDQNSVAYHRKEYERLKALHEEKTNKLEEHKRQVEALTHQIEEETRSLANIQSKLSVSISQVEVKSRRLNCLGWRETSECSATGARNPSGDVSCFTAVQPGLAGYCEFQDRDTGERFRVMESGCATIKEGDSFFCFAGADFANFPSAIAQVLEAPAKMPLATKEVALNTQGIALAMTAKNVESVYATVKSLRTLGCTLPIELWHFAADMKEAGGRAKALMAEIVADFAPLSMQEIKAEKITDFSMRVHAVYNSKFESVLYLDAGNVPVKDPTYLFSLPEFVDTGAVFWPDLWYPEHTINSIDADSLLWQLLRTDFVDEFEQDASQVLINRRQSAKPMEVLNFLATHRPSHFEKLKLLKGDKDLFRLSWRKAEAKFHYVTAPPALAGRVESEKFCGVSLAQHDPRGDIVFVNRNSQLGKGVENVLDQKLWTHVHKFQQTRQNTKENYRIEQYNGAPQFDEQQWCFGGSQPLLRTSGYFQDVAWQELALPADTEEKFIKYLAEARQLQPALVVQQPQAQPQQAQQ